MFSQFDIDHAGAIDVAIALAVLDHRLPAFGVLLCRLL
jgi:hypothetical protein